MQSTERPALTVTGREVRPRHLHDFARECTVGTWDPGAAEMGEVRRMRGTMQ